MTRLVGKDRELVANKRNLNLTSWFTTFCEFRFRLNLEELIDIQLFVLHHNFKEIKHNQIVILIRIEILENVLKQNLNRLNRFEFQ